MEKLSAEKGNCYFFTDRLNRRYLSGTDIKEGYLLIFETPVYFTDLRYYSAAKKALEKVKITALPYYSAESLTNFVKEKGVRCAYMDFSAITVAEYAEYKKIFGEIKDCSGLIASMRETKSEQEIKHIKKACKIAQRAVKEAFGIIKEGITETQVKDFIERRFKELGADGASFDTIVAFGENSAVPHHETGKRKLKCGEAVLIDTGAKVNGYCSDITRTAFFGKPTEEFLKVYEAVLFANEKAEREICAGITGKEADKIAREALYLRGYGDCFTHSLGHGVGLEIHEKPRLSPSGNAVLNENAAFTVEPGVYLDSKFGIRIEDTCILSGGKAVRLFTDGKKLKIIKTKK